MSTLVHKARGTITVVVMIVVSIAMVVMIMVSVAMVIMIMVSITMVVMIMITVCITRGASYFSGANSGGDTQWDQIW